MNKFFGFLAGAMCGAIVGSVTALLLTPASGNELRTEAVNRWEEAKRQGRLAMEEKKRELNAQFEQMKSGPTNNPQ
jgi:gas vesicle protein